MWGQIFKNHLLKNSTRFRKGIDSVPFFFCKGGVFASFSFAIVTVGGGKIKSHHVLLFKRVLLKLIEIQAKHTKIFVKKDGCSGTLT